MHLMYILLVRFLMKPTRLKQAWSRSLLETTLMCMAVLCWRHAVHTCGPCGVGALTEANDAKLLSHNWLEIKK